MSRGPTIDDEAAGGERVRVAVPERTWVPPGAAMHDLPPPVVRRAA